jgi:hypothetical protein
MTVRGRGPTFWKFNLLPLMSAVDHPLRMMTVFVARDRLLNFVSDRQDLLLIFRSAS